MSKLAKLVACAGIVCALTCGLAGCGQSGPKEVVDTALTAVKAMDGTTLATVYTGGKLDSKSKDVVGMLSAKDDVAMTTAVSNLSSSQQEFIADVSKKLCSFDYTVNSATVDNNTAKVNVTFKAYDFGSAYQDGMQGFGNSFIQAVSYGSDTDGEMTKALIAKVKDEVSDLKSKTKSKTIDLNLTYANGAWTLNELSRDQLDAMFGGIVSAFR